MSYEIENNYDWKKDLLEENIITDGSYCLISDLPLINGYITLPCSHSFNYYPIFHDVIKQKKYNYLDNVKLKYNQLKCPYCRCLHNNILPYYKINNIKKIYGVNSPESVSFKFHECKYCFTSGKKKGTICSKNAIMTDLGPFCNQHLSMTNKKDKEPLEKLKVIELKDILRKNGCKVGGTKSILIERIKLEKNNKKENWIE